MLKLFRVRLRNIPTTSSRSKNCLRISARFFGDKSHLLIGGGLEKFQGGLKEESYFRTHNYELIAKIRQKGSNKLKCENFLLSDWTEFEKVMVARPSPPTTVLRETCSLNKHKNCWEEAFFMNEQNECSKLTKEKLLNSSINFQYRRGNETTKPIKAEEMKEETQIHNE